MTHIIEEHIITELDMLKTITDSEEELHALPLRTWIGVAGITLNH